MNYIKKLYVKYNELVNYGIAGVLTTFICLSSYYLLTMTLLDAKIPIQLQIANIISWTIGVIFAYYVNRVFVFKSKNDNKKQEIFKFFLSRLFTLVLDMLFMGLTVTILGLNDKIMKIVSNIIVIIFNYILGKFVVFKKQSIIKK